MSSGRKYASVLIDIWRDQDWKKLTPDAQWLYLLLLSQPTMNTAGILPLQCSKWARYAEGTTEARVRAAVDVLADKRFIYVDGDTEEVLVRSFVRHGLTPSWKLLKAAVECACKAQSSAIRAVFLDELKRSEGYEKDELAGSVKVLVDTLSDTVSDGYGIPSVSVSVSVPVSSNSFKEKASNLFVELDGTRIAVSDAVRAAVQTSVPAAVLRARRTRDGLFGHAQMLFDDGATIDQLMATLNAWAKRTDAYPGHLPHIYTELARAGNGARPTGQQPHKSRVLADLAEQVRRMETTERMIEG